MCTDETSSKLLKRTRRRKPWNSAVARA